MLTQSLPFPGLVAFGSAATVPGLGSAAGANNQCGQAYQAPVSGTLNFVTIVGNPATSSAVDYRLCVYAAASDTVWGGALLGQTPVQNGLGISEVKKVALTAPVNVVAGQWYALTIQTAATMNTGCTTGGVGDRFFADNYADGAAATAGASALNSPNTRCISASTT